MCVTQRFGAGVGHTSLNNSSPKSTEQGVSGWIALVPLSELL